MKTIKQLLITVAVLLCSATASAYDFVVDGIYYNIISASDLTVGVTTGENKYSGDVIIPATVTYKSKTLTVSSINGSAFEDCTALSSITIPNSITIIKKAAFYGCTSLTSVTIPNSVKKIENEAFRNCKSLKELHIEDGETSLYFSMDNNNDFSRVFDYCLSLEKIHIGRDFDFYHCGSPSNSPFHEHYNLKTLTFSNYVTSIPENAFPYCKSLTDVEIPNSVTSIGESAFFGCTGLTNVTIGSNVSTIYYSAFEQCVSLTNIYLMCTTPPSVRSGNFTNTHYINTAVYVPKGSLATYQKADTWKNFWNIQEFDITAIENVEDVTPAFEITSNGIQFTAADSKTVAVYTIAGALIEKVNSYAGETITLDKGVYIIRIGEKTTKVKL